MNTKRTIMLSSVLVVISMLASACSNSAAVPAAAEPQALETETPAVTVTPLPPTETPAPTFTVGPTLTPTPDTRIPPEQWQDWPVVPSVTNRAREIYQLGLTMGLDPHHFSKIGDCQNVKNAFMGFFDHPDRYVLTAEYSHLADAIAWFQGQFDTDGQAVRQGLTANAALVSLWSDPNACEPNENPVACEIRLNRPTFMIISFERWYEGRTSENYETYMRQIIEYVMSQGVVPILATKADNVEGGNAMNYVTAKLAYEYDLPLWNFWRAVQPLANHGINTEPPNNDNFHISVEAWNVRSYTALDSLNSIWHGLTGEGQPSGG